MRLLLTACATAALVAAGPVTATAAGQGSQGPVGGDLLTAKPTVVATGASPPAVQASAFVVADLDTGQVLAAKAPHAKLRPASTLKTLTALVLLPRLKKTDPVIGSDADARIIGSKVGVYPGLHYTVDLLFQGMFLASGNDAVHALCAHDQGGVPATIQRMNAKAKDLGALDTTVTDPTGLDADGQYSSAYDLALFAQAGLSRPDFAKYASTKFTNFPNAGNKGTYQVANQNKLLFSYDGALGVKTGYTTLARNTFVGAARRNGHTLVVTMMNAPHGITEDAANLLTWAFANYGKLQPVGTLVRPAATPPKTTTDHKATTTGPEPGPDRPDRSRTVLSPGQAMQSLALRIPIWVYAAPPVLLLGLFLRRPRTLRRGRRH
ncbi:D-alanyl-D-alanine carboxypeptidase family protein [Kribbella solani]|uniref:D-alanyl-D-alanine carboxypeptidase (Penicillin-binding protein 5/6) n=1 Tax=Kribbella solani TaxID=236067 RepID=A0A841DS06_9ACTN|nr:D-alanyl-D-alanine carboxypeptidase family protein [Kribbella solani]MBB5980709.1 D-alanyl-D-alanine carboxypeptidase (penicillin-binding protein 5/6) [Kribbella solani]MDX2967613.1 D-alanyl-D-alanine carboxypeptidase [Kribbella solani]MDX3002545.1 D-alanyl-D-alanine carboxypeptidase [Kribbella solani]